MKKENKKDERYIKLSFTKEALRRFTYFFSRTIYFIFTIVFVFLFTRMLYNPILLKHSGISLLETVFAFGIIFGIWLFFAFVFLVFIEYDDIKKINRKKRYKNDKKRNKNK